MLTLAGAVDMLTILCVLLAYTRTILVMGSTEGKSMQKSDRLSKSFFARLRPIMLGRAWEQDRRGRRSR